MYIDYKLTKEKIVSEILEKGYVVIDIDKIEEEYIKHKIKKDLDAGAVSGIFIVEYYCLKNDIVRYIDFTEFYSYTRLLLSAECTVRIPMMVTTKYRNNISKTVFNKGDSFYVTARNKYQNEILKEYLNV